MLKSSQSSWNKDGWHSFRAQVSDKMDPPELWHGVDFSCHDLSTSFCCTSLMFQAILRPVVCKLQSSQYLTTPFNDRPQFATIASGRVLATGRRIVLRSEHGVEQHERRPDCHGEQELRHGTRHHDLGADDGHQERGDQPAVDDPAEEGGIGEGPEEGAVEEGELGGGHEEEHGGAAAGEEGGEEEDPEEEGVVEAEGAEVAHGAHGGGLGVGRRREGLGPGEAGQGPAGGTGAVAGVLHDGGGAPEYAAVGRHCRPARGLRFPFSLYYAERKTVGRPRWGRKNNATSSASANDAPEVTSRSKSPSEPSAMDGGGAKMELLWGGDAKILLGLKQAPSWSTESPVSQGSS
ncbi:Class-II DAHP synthetase family [Musa troglodytarum]|uniref:Class-II DAHP synthetase family n=1 Tax=Musa troglodytarum TaxID=320322 RepID=A0A9E7JGW6_9LILI|nr:Class-II DAHP synthetase family [Musa troglodytarum]